MVVACGQKSNKTKCEYLEGTGGPPAQVSPRPTQKKRSNSDPQAVARAFHESTSTSQQRISIHSGRYVAHTKTKPFDACCDKGAPLLFLRFLNLGAKDLSQTLILDKKIMQPRMKTPWPRYTRGIMPNKMAYYLLFSLTIFD